MLNTLYGKLAVALMALLGAIGLSYGLISHALTSVIFRRHNRASIAIWPATWSPTSG